MDISGWGAKRDESTYRVWVARRDKEALRQSFLSPLYQMTKHQSYYHSLPV